MFVDGTSALHKSSCRGSPVHLRTQRTSPQELNTFLMPTVAWPPLVHKLTLDNDAALPSVSLIFTIFRGRSPYRPELLTHLAWHVEHPMLPRGRSKLAPDSRCSAVKPDIGTNDMPLEVLSLNISDVNTCGSSNFFLCTYSLFEHG